MAEETRTEAPERAAPPTVRQPSAAPFVEEVMYRRFIARTRLRWARLGLLLLGSYSFVSWFREGLWDGDLLDYGYYFDRIFLTAGCILFLALLVVLESSFVRWLVPMPEARCPRCNYPIGMDGGRCSECGLPLPVLGAGEPDPRRGARR